MKILNKAKLFSSASEVEKQSIYDIKINDIRNQPISLSDFKGKKILFVNVASKCGFTKQYKELQELSETYKDQLTVIGLPCNQFGSQEPGNETQIQEFCDINFGVTFPLTEKIRVKGSQQHPLYNWLTSKSLNGEKNSKVRWNFQKYLVDEQGNLIDYFYSTTKPTSTKITSKL
ncbi:glutathione peroxidase [uncultured Tenacibaculum sp.]|uniref:glutathione peroxidase n=1 Tax=uncultured Tenacibaculum sp. TaxID=174713 RepID=UPI002627DF47|nr:glutathione peroxidase [uncultured Tenacibaculum sp.]